jgi:hypothetical protein
LKIKNLLAIDNWQYAIGNGTGTASVDADCLTRKGNVDVQAILIFQKIERVLMGMGRIPDT